MSSYYNNNGLHKTDNYFILPYFKTFNDNFINSSLYEPFNINLLPSFELNFESSESFMPLISFVSPIKLPAEPPIKPPIEPPAELPFELIISDLELFLDDSNYQYNLAEGDYFDN